MSIKAEIKTSPLETPQLSVSFYSKVSAAFDTLSKKIQTIANHIIQQFTDLISSFKSRFERPASKIDISPELPVSDLPPADPLDLPFHSVGSTPSPTPTAPLDLPFHSVGSLPSSPTPTAPLDLPFHSVDSPPSPTAPIESQLHSVGSPSSSSSSLSIDPPAILSPSPTQPLAFSPSAPAPSEAPLASAPEQVKAAEEVIENNRSNSVEEESEEDINAVEEDGEGAIDPLDEAEEAIAPPLEAPISPSSPAASSTADVTPTVSAEYARASKDSQNDLYNAIRIYQTLFATAAIGLTAYAIYMNVQTEGGNNLAINALNETCNIDENLPEKIAGVVYIAVREPFKIGGQVLGLASSLYNNLPSISRIPSLLGYGISALNSHINAVAETFAG